MSLLSSHSEGERRREGRNTVGPPPWSTRDRNQLVARVRRATNFRAKKLGIGRIGSMKSFVGYNGAELVAHLERRHLQGCLICGHDLAPAEPFEICHISPLSTAHDPARLVAMMALPNIGLAHVACNARLGARSVQ